MLQWAKHIKRERDGEPAACARCGRWESVLLILGLRLEAAHVIRRARSRNTRWHPRGGIPLCGPSRPGTCHYWYDEQASDEERAAFTVSIIGRATYDELHRIKNEPWDRDYGKVFAALKNAKEAA